MKNKLIPCLTLAMVCAVVAQQKRPVPRLLPGRFPGQNAKPQPVKWNEKQIVVTGTITDIKQGPTARSLPPIYNNTLTIKIDGVLRGGLKVGDQLQAHHSRSEERRVGEECRSRWSPYH